MNGLRALLEWVVTPLRSAKGSTLENIGEQMALSRMLYPKKNECTAGVSVHTRDGFFLGFQESDAHFRKRVLEAVQSTGRKP